MNNQFSIQNSRFPVAPRTALVAMSGGVDSTVAALLALRDGLDCAGAVMKLHQSDGSDTEDAKEAALKLGLPFYMLDFSDTFTEHVISAFINAYRKGRTPNPCVACNKNVKFGRLLKEARDMGKDILITGHYANIERNGSGRLLLKKGADPLKDQSYVLYTLKQEQLANIHFPLGGLTKQEVRSIALEAGLENAKKRESQDICFIPDGDYVKFIIEHTGETTRKGRFVDVHGKDLGENRGVVCYTVGQRRGMGLAMPYPAYVLELRPEEDTVVVGKDEMLYSKTLYAKNINFIPFDKLATPIRARVRIRYRHDEQPAVIRQTDNDTIRVDFDEPQRAITKGQAAVIYDDDVVIGGGTIM